jgi:hypothetical protein
VWAILQRVGAPKVFFTPNARNPLKSIVSKK